MTQLIGVYDADASLWGEVSYWIGARLGTRHCSLCDITHGMFRQKPEWVECRNKLGIEFVTFHRDDQPDDVRQLLNGSYPAVVLRSDDGTLKLLMDGAQISRCGQSSEVFIAEIQRQLQS